MTKQTGHLRYQTETQTCKTQKKNEKSNIFRTRKYIKSNYKASPQWVNFDVCVFCDDAVIELKKPLCIPNNYVYLEQDRKQVGVLCTVKHVLIPGRCRFVSADCSKAVIRVCDFVVPSQSTLSLVSVS